MRVFGNMMNRVMEDQSTPAPEVGMGATLCWYSDRDAGTVIEVSASGKEIKVQRDLAIRTDGNRMSDSQSYRYEPNPEGEIEVFTLRKNGRWVLKGTGMQYTPNCQLGYRKAYHDYGF